MTRNLIRLSDHLELPAPVALGMILIAAAFAKGGHSFLGIGGMVTFHALFIVARHALGRFNEQEVAFESVPPAKRPGLWFVLVAPVTSTRPAFPVSPRNPRSSPAPRTPFRRAA